MSEIVLWYDYIENGKIRNNLKFETGITNGNVGLPNFFIQNNIDFVISSTAYGAEHFYRKYSNLKNFYPIEFLFYNSLDNTDNQPIKDHWFFKKNIPSNIEILIWYPGEGFELRRNNESINRFCALLRGPIPNITIRFIFGNFVKPKNLPDYVIYKCFKNYFWFDTVNKMPCRTTLDINKESQYDFITLNKRYRESRYMVFTDLKNSGMLVNAKYTNMLDGGLIKATESYRIEQIISNKNSQFIAENTIAEDWLFINNLQTPSYFEELRDCAGKTWSTEPSHVNIRLPDVDLVNCSYLEVVNETTFDSVSNLFITEKTFRAIAVGHIFLICGQPGTLAHLKQEGFQTFDDLFDESYDNITSFTERWKIIKKNLQLWINMSEVEKKSYYLKSFDKLVHNQNLLYNRNFKREIQELFKD